MDNVYLLLRKNQQTGPYTYEELLQQQLLPTDLIWVEGKSMAWLSPSELAQFLTESKKNKAASPEAIHHAGRSTATQTTPPEVPWYLNRKSPEAELEERALALRERAQAAAIQHDNRPNASSVPQQRHRRVVYQQEESPVLLEVHTRHKKSVTLPQLIAAGVITALVAAGWYNREVLQIVRPQQNTITQAAAPAVFKVSLPVPPKPAAMAIADTTPAEPRDTVAAALAVAPVPPPRQKPLKAKATEAEAEASETTTAEPTGVKAATTEKKETVSTDTAGASKAAEKKDTAEAVVAQANEDAAVEPATPQKKKGLGQALKNIFKKKKKNEDKVADENSGSE